MAYRTIRLEEDEVKQIIIDHLRKNGVQVDRPEMRWPTPVELDNGDAKYIELHERCVLPSKE